MIKIFFPYQTLSWCMMNISPRDHLLIRWPGLLWWPSQGPGLKYHTAPPGAVAGAGLFFEPASKNKGCPHQSSAPGSEQECCCSASWCCCESFEAEVNHNCIHVYYQPAALWQCCALDSNWWAGSVPSEFSNKILVLILKYSPLYE